MKDHSVLFSLAGVLFLIMPTVCAETIVLKSGNTLENSVLEKTDKYIKTDFQGKTLTYYSDEISTIDGKSFEVFVANPVKTSADDAQPQAPIAASNSESFCFEDNTGLEDFQQTPEQLAILADISARTAGIKDLEFDYRSESISKEGKRHTQESQIKIKFPDKAWAKESKRSSDGSFEASNREDFEVGNVWWWITSHKNVKKVIRDRRRPPFPSIPNPVNIYECCTENGHLKVINYGFENTWKKLKVGEQTIGGDVYYVLAAGEKQRLWIQKSTGILRHRETSYADDKSKFFTGYWKAEDFFNVKFNVGLQDEMFNYEPQPGTSVTEQTETLNGTTFKSWTVPYPEPDLSSPAAQTSQGQMEELLAKYRALKSLSARYKYYQLHDSQVSSQDNPKDLKQVWSKIEGTLTFAAPDRVRFEYEETTESRPATSGFYITDGSQYWSPLRGQLNYVRKGSIKLEKEMAGHLMKGLADEQAFYSKMSGSQGSLESGLLHPISFYLRVPITPGFQEVDDMLSLKPLKGIDPRFITYLGEEDVNGTKTKKFEVRESEKQNRSIHWIGLDGVVRKIEEYSKYKNGVQVKIDLADVKTDNANDDKTFIYEPVAGIQGMDMNQGMNELQRQMKEAANLPPEKIFQAYFENSLEDVKELQGFGFSMLNVEVCIRFQSDKEIVLKNKEQYEVVNSRDAGEMEFQKKPNIKEIAGDLLPDCARDRQFPRKTKIKEIEEFLIRAFPKDEKSLKSLEAFTAMQVDAHGRRAWILFNKSKGLYFFRAQADFIN